MKISEFIKKLNKFDSNLEIGMDVNSKFDGELLITSVTVTKDNRIIRYGEESEFLVVNVF